MSDAITGMISGRLRLAARNWMGAGALLTLLWAAGCGGRSGGSAATPVHWWRGEGNALDSAGTSNGTLVGTVAFQPATSGQGFSFDGSRSGVMVPDSASLAFTGSFSIQAQVRVNALPPAGQLWGMILFRGDDRAGLDPYFLAVHQNGNLYFHVESTTGAADLLAPMPLGRFVRVTASLNVVNGQMTLCLDGATAAETVTTVRPLITLDPGQNAGVGIGNHPGQPTTTQNYPLNGIIDELKVFGEVVGC